MTINGGCLIVVFFNVPSCFVDALLSNVGKPFNRFIPKGLPAEVRLLPLGARSDWLIPSTTTSCVPEGLPEVVEQFHKRHCDLLLFVVVRIKYQF